MGRSLLPLVVLGAALLAAPGAAEIYRWVDGNGKEHFTTRLEDVPAPDREGAQVEAASRRRLNRAAPRAEVEPKPRSTPVERKLWQVEDPKPEGHDETWWRSQHAEKLDRVTDLEERIAEYERLGVTQAPAPHRVSNASRRRWHRYMGRWRARQRAESDLRAARRALERFEERARRAGAPPGWLRRR